MVALIRPKEVITNDIICQLAFSMSYNAISKPISKHAVDGGMLSELLEIMKLDKIEIEISEKGNCSLSGKYDLECWFIKSALEEYYDIEVLE